MSHVFVSGIVPPATRSARPHWFVVGAKGLVLRGEGVTLPTTEELQAAGLGLEGAHYLGRLDGEDAFALGHSGAVPEGFAERGLRSLFGQFDETLFSVAGRAVQLVAWDETHRFCGRCATPTAIEAGERVRVCPQCGLRSYPRISPAVIVLVRRGERVLLARSTRFPAAFYSTLAGFVEAGESLEETVAREIQEEVGVEVRNLRYFGSQPWPFPNSLMIGFNADYAGGEIHVDGVEIADANWFTADALPQLPGKPSIARQLIDAWVKEQTGREG